MRMFAVLLLALIVAGCLPAAPPAPTPTPPIPATPAPTSAPPATEEREASPTPAATRAQPTAQPTALPAASDGLGDPYYPQLGNGGYDAQHYTLDLAADMRSGTISGTVTLAARATAELQAFDLHLQR